MKIANKISLWFFFTGAVLVSVAAAFFYNITSVSLRESIRQDLSRNAELYADEIELYLKMLKSAVVSTSKSVVIPRALKTAKEDPAYAEDLRSVTKLLTMKKSADEAVFEYMLLDSAGTVVAASEPTSVGKDKSADAYFLGAQNGVFIKDPYNSRTKNMPLMAVSAPVTDDAGTFLGVLVARVTMDEIDRIVTSGIAMGNTGEVFLINKYGYMITPSRFMKDSFLKVRMETANSRAIQSHKGKEHPESCGILRSEYFDYRGALVLGTHEFLPDIKWGLIVKVDAKEALSPLRLLDRVFLLILLLATVMSWVMGKIVARIIARPIQELRRGVETLGKGQWDHRLKIQTKDEVGELAKSFNKMAEDLRSLMRKEKEFSLADARVEAEKARANEFNVLNQQLISGEQKLKASHQQILENEESLREANRRLVANEAALKTAKAGLEQQVAERTQELEGARVSLELEVQKRTLELQEKVDGLNKLNASMVGRELRVIELKKEINKLCREAGKPEPYSC